MKTIKDVPTPNCVAFVPTQFRQYAQLWHSTLESHAAGLNPYISPLPQNNEYWQRRLQEVRRKI